MEKRSYNQEKELREYFTSIPAEPMPDALKERIMAGVRMAEEKKSELQSERWELISVIAVSVLLIVAAIWGALHYKMIPEITFDLNFKRPSINLEGARIWVMLGVTGLLLLMGESLLARHFIDKRRNTKTPR